MWKEIKKNQEFCPSCGAKVMEENLDEEKEEQEEVLVTVPSVIDKNQKEAIKELEKLSLKVKIEEQETEEEVGIVFEQEPVDKKVKKNSEVTIRVYISMEKAEMVPVVGDTLEDATKKLEAIKVATN